MRPSAPPLLFGRSARRVHCLGLGGMGVAPLAIYLAQTGFAVSGEDDAMPAGVRALLAQAGVAVGPLPAQAEIVVYSSAIPREHPVYAAVATRGLPLVRRGEMLAEIMRGRRLVAVCGAHGKTTTTAMLVTALRRAGFPAGYILGGLFNDDTPPARAGSNEWVVAEVDESDGTIEGFSPEITLAVNLDWDHPDHYRAAADLDATFAALFARTTGTVLVSDACARSLRMAAGRAVQTFGRTGDFSGEIAAESAAGMTLRLGGRFGVREAAVRTQGDFNAANATAALAAAQLMGIAPEAGDLLAEFPGVRRRQGILSAAGGVTVIEDYAHHPTEIRALLGSLRRRAGAEGRVIVVFQPHPFSRTAQFKAEFSAAQALADRVHQHDVYAAGESPVAGGTTADIYAEMKQGAGALPVSYLPGGGAGLFRALSRETRAGDLVAFVGAGDIDRHARAWLGDREAAGARAGLWDDLCRGGAAPPFGGGQNRARGAAGAEDHPAGGRRGAALCGAGECRGPAAPPPGGGGPGRGSFHAGAGIQSHHSRRRGGRVGHFPGALLLGPLRAAAGRAGARGRGAEIEKSLRPRRAGGRDGFRVSRGDSRQRRRGAADECGRHGRMDVRCG